MLVAQNCFAKGLALEVEQLQEKYREVLPRMLLRHTVCQTRKEFQE
jgi:hypothetical protein